MTKVYSYNTKKTPEGFTAIATAITEGSCEILKSAGPFKTRARAKSHAVKLVKYFKAQNA
jgi:hypothetical protein